MDVKQYDYQRLPNSREREETQLLGANHSMNCVTKYARKGAKQ